MKRALATAFALLASVNLALGCTAVDIAAADGSVLAGRTMEWAFDMKWTLVSQPKGTQLQLAAPKATGLPTNTFATKYAVVGVSAGIIPGVTLLDGQNSEGLSMSANFLPGFTQYQTVTKADTQYQSILTFGSWALGGFASVAELRAALPAMKVWADDSLPTGPTPATLHFVFVDRSGAGIVVEYVGGALRVYDNAAHVLLRHYVTAPKDISEATQAVAHILNNVDIPLGVAAFRNADGSYGSDYTQWVVLKDLTNNRLTIADYAHRTGFLTIELDALFALDAPAGKLVTDLPYPKATAGAAVLAP